MRRWFHLNRHQLFSFTDEAQIITESVRLSLVDVLNVNRFVLLFAESSHGPTTFITDLNEDVVFPPMRPQASCLLGCGVTWQRRLSELAPYLQVKGLNWTHALVLKQ